MQTHRRAEELMMRGDRALARGSGDEAASFYCEAAQTEADAFDDIPPERPETRGILAVSAVALYRKAGRLAEAERQALAFLADAGLPEGARDDLNELLAEVRDNHVELAHGKKGRRVMPRDRKRVAYLGPEFTHSHAAAMAMFPDCHYFYQPTAEDVFAQVLSKEMDYGITPVQNSTTGLVHEFFSLLVNQPFALPETGVIAQRAFNVRARIVRELYVAIENHLLTKGMVPLGKIQRIYSNQQPYLQSVRSLSAKVPNAVWVPTESTAAAADALNNDPMAASIGSALLAKHKKLQSRGTVQDNPLNVTRFLGISATKPIQSQENNKATFAITIPNRIGTLVAALKLVSDAGVNISSLHMVPYHNNSEIFKDWFVIDGDKPEESQEFKYLLQELLRDDRGMEVKVLGSYVSGWIDPVGQQPRQTPTEPSGLGHRELIEQLISGGESDHVEFKSSLRYDYKAGVPNKDLSAAIAKAICGFLNADGGYLFIGVSDRGEPIGIEPDLQTLSKSTRDGFLQAFYSAITKPIQDFSHFSKDIHPEFIELQGKLICCIRVEPASRPAWVAGSGDEPIFFLRVGVSTNPQGARAATNYIRSHFKDL
jgi:chorismate mutase/prephenate dehydratase